MPRKRTWPPRIYHHPNGQDRIRITLPGGAVKDIWLGKTGSEEARQNYLRVVAEIEANRGVPLPRPSATRTVAELVCAYLEWFQGYHTPTHTRKAKLVFRVVLEMYRHGRLEDFGPLALEAVQGRMVQLGWGRRFINEATRMIRQCWRWGASRELIPFVYFDRLRTVPGLRRGKTTAAEPRPVLDVPLEVVQATLPHLAKPVAGLVRFQMFTGARPGEAVLLRPCDIDREALRVDGVTIWVYHPQAHKNAWRNLWRAIPIGPRCQAMLQEFLEREPTAYCFSPRDGVRNANRERCKDHYTPSTYRRAISRACRRHGIPSWHPYQLRHAVATRIELERQRGWESATVILGHHDPRTARIYAHGDLQRAARIVAQFG